MSRFVHSVKTVKKIKVLVIDDFDRLDDELQKELYLIFKAIYENENGYLSKIINQKNNVTIFIAI